MTELNATSTMKWMKTNFGSLNATLKNDPQLAEELAFMRVLSGSVNSGGKLKLMDMMDNIRQEEEKRGKLIVFYKHVLAYAASLLLLIATGIGVWHYSGNRGNEKVYLNYYHPEPVSFAVRSATMSSDQPVMHGLELFEKKEYAAAIDYFNQSPDNPMGRLYGGLAHMELGDFNKAIVDFNAILNQNDNLFIDQAAWYLSLCYLKTNRQKDLEQSLRLIASGRSIYRTKALKLMNELGITQE